MSGIRRPRALILSTTPPYPRDYGNRNRVFQTLEFLKSCGYSLSFILYPLDEDWSRAIPDYYRILVEQFDYFAVIPNSKPLHRNAIGRHHGIDEWWDENIARHLEWLFARRRFDLFLVNYTFLSEAFHYAPKGCFKLLDTHDQFTGRREMFESQGLQPEFFYTTRDQEEIAFDRADATIAIKPAEAAFIESVSTKPVFTIPYWDTRPLDANPARRYNREFCHADPLRLGFIGAANSVNSVNVRRFLVRFDRWVRLYNLPVRVVLAGNMCRSITRDYEFVDKLGRVETLAEFYDRIDCVIAPLEFSTGMKIKVAEALSWGLPVVATQNAFDGFQPFHKLQAEATVEEMCESLASLATNELSLADLASASRRASGDALRARDRGYAALRAHLRETTRRIVVVVGRPFWRRATLVDEQIAQSIEFLAHIAHTVVIVRADEQVRADRVYAEVEYVEIEDGGVAETVAEIADVCDIVSVVFCSGMGPIEAQVAKHGIPVFRLHCGTSDARLEGGQSELRAVGKPGAISLSNLRYLPVGSVGLVQTRVAIFSAAIASEWDLAVVEYVAYACARRGMEVVRPRVDGHAEFDARFFSALKGEGAHKVIALAAAPWLSAISEACSLRGASLMVVGPSFVAPVSSRSGDEPSLMAAIEAFLDRNTTVKLAPHRNRGWDEVWRLFSGPKRPLAKTG
jgi:glycosyltransferase involved in cell wall biosynthesis